jgi:hypothetical protein
MKIYKSLCGGIAFLVMLLLFLSCKNKSTNKLLSAADVELLSKEFNLPVNKMFQLDKSYIKFLFSLDTSKYADAIQNHYQPIQATYYNKQGRLISFHANCYAGIGVKEDEELNWNQQNAFASFVPVSVVPLDSILPLATHLQFIKNFQHEYIDTTGFSKYEYTVIIHYGKKWRPTDSKNLIKLVKQNMLPAKAETVNILYVNNDNSW